MNMNTVNAFHHSHTHTKVGVMTRKISIIDASAAFPKPIANFFGTPNIFSLGSSGKILLIAKPAIENIKLSSMPTPMRIK